MEMAPCPVGDLDDALKQQIISKTQIQRIRKRTYLKTKVSMLLGSDMAEALDVALEEEWEEDFSVEAQDEVSDEVVGKTV